ncbi:polyketide cyclase [Frankia sp. CcI49]|uniref:nuclear transport factor 2 family protein n=1 Tax=unclassified Frankia TaxID=2632575 RepID=UPI0006C9EB98|nr:MULTISPECIES: nuclear transport factor 2 family protein [unclassified Frankia]KPM52351.1 polyketide cyclase [Frankia sp. R43]ONH59946.1 polyketide cyclase [Frankia sp. CcI49]
MTSDRDAIADVLLRYSTGIDRRDWDLFRSCFTDDCDLDYGEIGSWRGAAAFTEVFTALHAPLGHTMHSLSNIDIRLDGDGDGDRARARTYVNALIMSVDGRSGVTAHGFYDDDLVRTAGGWRIARRHFTSVHTGSVGAPADAAGGGS